MRVRLRDDMPPPQRVHAHRFAPYSVRIADAVDKALQQPFRTESLLPAPMARTRHALAAKLQLAAQSTINMATYLEQRAATNAITQTTAMSKRTRVDGASDNDDESECTICCICLEPTRARKANAPLLRALQCGHVFHCDCIRAWLRHRRCCPIDRTDVSSNDANDANDARASGIDTWHDWD